MNHSELGKKGAAKRRFFIAAMPPTNIQDITAKIREKGPDHWKWQHPHDYHISIAFPGELTEEQVEKLIKILKQIDFSAFDVQVKGLKAFNRSGHPQKAPHVLWAGLNASGDAHFRELHKRVSQILNDHGFNSGRRDMEPHITLAKVPNNEMDAMLDIIRKEDGLTSETWRCEELILFETRARNRDHMANDPSPYLEVERFRLKP
jgi:2'-5' RNA ligase